jgi:hypothetical protein
MKIALKQNNSGTLEGSGLNLTFVIKLCLLPLKGVKKFFKGSRLCMLLSGKEVK